jgi:hypothetical protein
MQPTSRPARSEPIALRLGGGIVLCVIGWPAVLKEFLLTLPLSLQARASAGERNSGLRLGL